MFQMQYFISFFLLVDYTFQISIQLILFGMSQNVHISSLTAPESLGPMDSQNLSQRNKAVLMPSELPWYTNAYNTERSAKSVANFNVLSQESF
jgi:hypothetical protein